MFTQDSMRTEIARNFLETNTNYLELALAVEEAVESLRDRAAEELDAELVAKLKALREQENSKGWLLTPTIKYIKTPHPKLWQRLYKRGESWDDKNQYEGISIGRWTSHRLSLHVSAVGPAAAVTNARVHFHGFMKSPDRRRELWEKNQDRENEVSYVFHGDRVFLIGDIRSELETIVTLMEGLLTVFDPE